MSKKDVKNRQYIRNFIENNLIIYDDEAEFADEDNIFQKGFVSSLFAMKLLNFIEQEFQIKVSNDNLELIRMVCVNII